MNKQLMTWATLVALLLGAPLVLASCGGGGGGSSGGGITPPPEPGLEIDGRVLQPSVENPSLRIAKLGFYAPTTLLDPVPGAIVELWEVDDDGNLLGTDPIGTTTASITGDWRITLPAGTNLHAKLVVLTRLGPDVLRGQVVSEFVTISPLSEFVLRSLTSDGHDLGNVSPTDVITLSGYVEEADLRKVLDTGSIDDALLGLASHFGEDTGFDTIVDDSQQPSADATSATGRYWYSDTGTQLNSFMYALSSLEVGEFDVVGHADGTGTATAAGLTSIVMAQPLMMQPMGFSYGLVYEIEVEDPDAFGSTFSHNADGTVTVLQPFEEEICDPLSPCAGTGWRYAPATASFCPVSQRGDNGVYAAMVTERGIQYSLTGEGTIDADSPLGTSTSYYMELLAKQGPVLNADVHDTIYGAVAFGQGMASGKGDREVVGARVGIYLQADEGTATGELGFDIEELRLRRTPDEQPPTAYVRWDDTGPGGEDDPEPTTAGTSGIPYTLDEATGRLVYGLEGDERQAFFGNGGDVVLMSDSMGENEGAAENYFGIGVRLPTEGQPMIDEGNYKVLWMDLCYGESGAMEVTRSVGATLDFQLAQMLVPGITSVVEPPLALTGSGVFRMKMHDADTAPTGGNDDLSLTGHWSWDDSETPGALSFTLEEDGDVIHAQGFMNFDGSFGVFRLWSSQLEGEGGDACIGIALLIREPDRN